jgi:hypothetical protein
VTDRFEGGDIIAPLLLTTAVVIQLETFKIGEKVSIITIVPDPKKSDKDIPIPVLSPILTRKKSLAEEIAGLDVQSFSCPVLPRKQDDAVAKRRAAWFRTRSVAAT